MLGEFRATDLHVILFNIVITVFVSTNVSADGGPISYIGIVIYILYNVYNIVRECDHFTQGSVCIIITFVYNIIMDEPIVFYY